MAAKLTQKQKKAANEYLKDLNQTRAYIAAGYSENGAKSGAARLFANVNIKAYIEAELNKHALNCGITVERVLSELAKLAFFDPRKLFESDGSPKQLHELDDDTAMAVAGFEFIELFEGTDDQKHAYGLLKKYKLTDKRAALVDIGKHLKMFTEKVENTGPGGGPMVFTLRKIEGKTNG